MAIRRVLPLFVLLAGCTVGPDFAPPASWSPTSWFSSRPRSGLSESLPVEAPLDFAWWDSFHDPVLSGLVARAATENLDVLAATSRLAQSRSQRGIAAASAFPQLNGSANYTRQRPSERGVTSLLGGGGGGAGAGGQGGIPNSAGLGDFDLFQGGFDAAWELDLWGRVRRSVEAADASVAASGEARRAALLSSIAEVARDYLQLRGVQATLQITRDNLAIAQDSAALTASRFRAGLATDLDVANAQAQAEATGAQVPQLEQQEAQAINRIGLLLALPPASLAGELAPRGPIAALPVRVPIGLPSELARRRPDIRQAEAQLHAATAEIGAAQADFYPRISLSGNAAMQALQFHDLGSWAARTYSFGPSLTLPIFEGGRLRRTLELRQGQQQEAAIAFRRTVLQAFIEVDDALVAYAKEQQRRDRLAAQASQARRALGLAQSRFRQGLSDFLEVLTAQRTRLQAEQQLADSTATASTNLVALYKALGGGWEQAYPRDEARISPR